MKKIYFVGMLIHSVVFAQLPGKEAWRWYFGHKCGMDFSSGSAVGIPGIPAYYISGGCASISDENTGQYLFSVGGTRIYNRNNVVMNNGYGLYGTNTNTQDLIVRQPGSSKMFFVFTPDQLGSTPKGVTYSIVDMGQQGGIGSVTVKNKLLTPPPTTEKVTVVRHCNGIDYWVLTHPANSNTINAYLLTSSGLDTIPVVSNVGVVHQGIHCSSSWCYEYMGVLKASPNGKKLVSAIQSDSLPVMEVFDFNNSTGQASNPLQFNYPGKFGPYGASFSPDNSKLYCVAYSGNMNQDTSYLYQYDLSSGAPSQIILSETLINKGSYNYGFGASLGELQIGPDGKIYAAIFSNDTVAAIAHPNAAGIACGYQFNAVVLPNTSLSIWGLPNFIDANYAGIQIDVPDLYLCNSIAGASFDAGAGYASYQWSTGATTQTISVNSPGKYWVTVTAGPGCQRTDTMTAFVVQPFKIDTSVCDSFKANISQAGAQQYLWSDSTVIPVKDITSSGNYYVDITYSSGCTLRDTVNVSVISSPQVELGPSVSLCDFKIDLNAYYPGVTFNWNTGATTSSVTVSEPGTYWVTLQNASGCKGSDTLVIGPPWQLIDLHIPNIVTPNDDKINDEVDFEKFQFSSLNMQIFNRWGQKVFESDSPSAIWKPTVDDGTYFYTGQYKINCGTASQARDIKGFITVVR